MNTAERRYRLLSIVAALATAPSLACDSHVLRFPASDRSVADCLVSPYWYGTDEEPDIAAQPPHPDAECGFYTAAVQYFTFATRPVTGGDPALTSYATIDDTFARAHPLASGALAPSGTHRGTAERAWLGHVRQPGDDTILVDQSGHAIYYGVSLNGAFVNFVNGHALQTAAAIENADPALAFPPGVATYRSAWKDIDPADGVTGDFSTFVTTDAWVSSLQIDAAGTIVEDRDHPRHIRVALLAADVAFSIPGHSELIWATFQHVGVDGSSDLAPAASTQPASFVARAVPSPMSELLYHGNTPAMLANQPYSDSQLQLDGATQTFAQSTSIYRAYPASQSTTTEERSEVKSVNGTTLGLQSALADVRGAYALVGAVWMDKPGYFGIDESLQNDLSSPFVTGAHVDQDGNTVPAVSPDQFQASMGIYGVDSPYSIVAGTDRLSNPAIESFTQNGTFNNCLACHNTQGVSARGLPAPQDTNQPTLLTPKLINVSRVFSQFLLEECGPSGVCPAP